MTRRAAQYLRVSSVMQRPSLDGQAQEIAAFAALQGYELVRTYADLGKSGLTLKARPGLQQLLADVLGGAADFDTVLVQDISRWGRFQDGDEAAHYEFICRQAGVEVRYASELFDPAGHPASALFKALKRLMAAEFSRELSAKTRRAQFQLADAGFKMGGVAGYGLRRAVLAPGGEILGVLEAGQQKLLHGQRVIYVHGPPEEVATVRRIFQFYLDEDLGLGGIAERLNQEGVAGERGRPWASWSIGQVLTNPKYAGDYVFGRRRRSLDGQRHDAPPNAWLRVQGVVAPIVTRERLAAAAAKRRGRRLFLSSAEILQRLRRRRGRVGDLTRAAVEAAADLPSAQTVSDHLGPWPRVCARLGQYPAPPAAAHCDILPGYIDLSGELGDKADWRTLAPMSQTAASHAVFLGDQMIAAGDLATVALAARAAQTAGGPMPLVLEDATGGVVDLDLRGEAAEVLARLPEAGAKADAPVEAKPGRGRPKLGVIPREVTLLPRHWTWLASQPGGASATLRRLVEAAARSSRDPDARRAAQTAAYKAMYALAGHLPGYEAALRALYASARDDFEAQLGAWPADVSAYLRRLAAPVWALSIQVPSDSAAGEP